MSYYNTYITFTSWEERFLKSFEKDTKENNFERIILLSFENGHHLEKQQEIINQVQKYKSPLKITYLTFSDDIKIWKQFKNELFNNENNNFGKVLLNISTMPRNVIYYLLHFLDLKNIQYTSIYYKAFGHSEKLTKNPLKPSLILQHSGIFELEKPTLLIACVGYDEKRVFQLYNHFEPKEVILLMEKEHISTVNLDTNFDFSLIPNRIIEDISSFLPNNIYNKLENIYNEKSSTYNILLCSLGPKLSTIEFFRFQKTHTECGLIYIGSKDYCKDYSSGIDLDNPILV
ncbi:hypothetical protein [Aliarcobacter lanthieri]|uniref:hypothetical protein n=1 Tax=Aliarcobacter lanthieri TaxID=1355374 RepID=UPI00047CB33D|nr:hypothetical protein [Aliarcobacter lanthieri]